MDQTDDPIIDYQNHFSYLPNAGAGIYYYYKSFHLGLSVLQLLPVKANFGTGVQTVSIERVFHYYALVGGEIKAGHRWYLQPKFWYKQSKSSPWQVDGYIRATYHRQFWIGAGYRTSGTIIADFGFVVKQHLQINYVYDFQVTPFSQLLGSSHEIVVGYRFSTRHTAARKRY